MKIFIKNVSVICLGLICVYYLDWRYLNLIPAWNWPWCQLPFMLLILGGLVWANWQAFPLLEDHRIRLVFIMIFSAGVLFFLFTVPFKQAGYDRAHNETRKELINRLVEDFPDEYKRMPDGSIAKIRKK